MVQTMVQLLPAAANFCNCSHKESAVTLSNPGKRDSTDQIQKTVKFRDGDDMDPRVKYRMHPFHCSTKESGVVKY